MTSHITICKLDPRDEVSILKIADWYLNEWNTPVEKTIQRLVNQPDDNTLFQAILKVDEKLVATGGLCNVVNIYSKHPELERFKPWIALLYTQQEYRCRGLGQKMLDFIEQSAKDIGLNRIFLYTFSAESLYKRNGWKEITRVDYKNHDTVVMEKVI